MKAVISVAGYGSRLRPLTNNTPKSLLPVGQTNALDRMIDGLLKRNIHEFVFVTGYLENKIKAYLAKNFPDIDAHFVRNELYEQTNDGYSLLLAEPYVYGETFVRFPGDIVFEPKILDMLMGAPNDANYLCLDKGLINEEVFKIKADHTGAIRTLGAHVQVGEAAGATLGIEKITSKYCKSLFSTLHQLMADHKNWQEYYEYAFDHQIRNKTSSFKYVDVTGLKWVEMDTPEDYRLAKSYFGEAASRSPTKRSSRMAFPD